MKRFSAAGRAGLVAVVLLLLPCALFAFDTKSRLRSKRQAPRVGVLRVAEEHAHAREYVATNVVRHLREELVERGIDAYDTGLTYGEVADGQGEDADYFVEILGAHTSDDSYGGIGVGSHEVGVTVDVVVSRVAAEVRIYDGHTGELLRSEMLAKRRTAVMPTSVYFGGSRIFAVLAMPFVQQSQYRSLTRAAARDAALIVVEAVAESPRAE